MNNAELFSWKPLFLLLVSFIGEKQLCVYGFFLKQIRQKFCGIFFGVSTKHKNPSNNNKNNNRKHYF